MPGPQERLLSLPLQLPSSLGQLFPQPLSVPVLLELPLQRPCLPLLFLFEPWPLPLLQPAVQDAPVSDVMVSVGSRRR